MFDKIHIGNGNHNPRVHWLIDLESYGIEIDKRLSFIQND